MKLFYIGTSDAPPINPFRRRLQYIRIIWNGSGDFLGKNITIAESENFGLQRIAMLTVECLTLLSPNVILQGVLAWLFKLKEIWLFMFAEFWYVVKPIFLLVLLYCQATIATFAAVYFVAELFVYQLNVVWLDGIFGPLKSAKRSMMLLFFNFVELVFAFAIFYSNFGSIVCDSKSLSVWSEAIYFSFVTAATVGFGDCTPSSQTGQLLVALHIMINFLFVTIIIAYFSSRYNK